MGANFEMRILDLEIMAAKIRRNVLDMCKQNGGYAGQGVALAEIGACLYFDEMRPDRDGWWADGEERQRVRPVPVADRLTGHAGLHR